MELCDYCKWHSNELKAKLDRERWQIKSKWILSIMSFHIYDIWTAFRKFRDRALSSFAHAWLEISERPRSLQLSICLALHFGKRPVSLQICICLAWNFVKRPVSLQLCMCLTWNFEKTPVSIQLCIHSPSLFWNVTVYIQHFIHCNEQN